MPAVLLFRRGPCWTLTNRNYLPCKNQHSRFPPPGSIDEESRSAHQQTNWRDRIGRRSSRLRHALTQSSTTGARRLKGICTAHASMGARRCHLPNLSTRLFGGGKLQRDHDAIRSAE